MSPRISSVLRAEMASEDLGPPNTGDSSISIAINQNDARNIATDDWKNAVAFLCFGKVVNTMEEES